LCPDALYVLVGFLTPWHRVHVACSCREAYRILYNAPRTWSDLSLEVNEGLVEAVERLDHVIAPPPPFVYARHLSLSHSRWLSPKWFQRLQSLDLSSYCCTATDLQSLRDAPRSLRHIGIDFFLYANTMKRDDFLHTVAHECPQVRDYRLDLGMIGVDSLNLAPLEHVHTLTLAAQAVLNLPVALEGCQGLETLHVHEYGYRNAWYHLHIAVNQPDSASVIQVRTLRTFRYTMDMVKLEDKDPAIGPPEEAVGCVRLFIELLRTLFPNLEHVVLEFTTEFLVARWIAIARSHFDEFWRPSPLRSYRIECREDLWCTGTRERTTSDAFHVTAAAP
jgi:hypothetical protein